MSRNPPPGRGGQPGNGRAAPPTKEQLAQLAAMQAQQRAAQMMMRRETLAGIVLNGMLSGLNWQPTGQQYPQEDCDELCRDAVQFAEGLLKALYPPPPEAANTDQAAGADKPEETFGRAPEGTEAGGSAGEPAAGDAQPETSGTAVEPQPDPPAPESGAREDVVGLEPSPQEGSIRVDDGQGTQD